MAYQAFYRVYRPQSFAEMSGQAHVKQTLQNALLYNKTTHAYLFNGPRGTGKTSAAKIFAKALNCEKAPVSSRVMNVKRVKVLRMDRIQMLLNSMLHPIHE